MAKSKAAGGCSPPAAGERRQRHLIIKPQRAQSKFCSRLFDQHVVVWEKKTGGLFMSQPAHQPLAVSVCLPPGSMIWAPPPKTGGEQRVRETKSNLTFCSCIQSSRLACDGIVRLLKAVISLWFLDIQLYIWHSVYLVLESHADSVWRVGRAVCQRVFMWPCWC